MIIRKLVFGVVLVLALGSTNIAFAKENRNQRQINKSSAITMNSMMGQYEYDKLPRDNKNGGYVAMNDFMNNLSDDDYQKMIGFMREYGYGNMDSIMERIDKDGMISMHSAMGDAVSCLR